MIDDLHGRSVVADTHNDLLDAIAHRPVERWVPHFRERWLPQLQQGGVNLQVLPVFVDDVFRPEGALRQTLRMIEAAHRIAAASPETRLCSTGAEIDEALAHDQIALVLALESAPGVGEDVELLETLYRLGVRIASLAHFGRTALADGSGEDGTGSRLTRAGVAAHAEMERLGMIFDVSHLGAAGVEHVLELSTRPVMATHSSARALRDHHRNLTDAQLRGIADTGGVVCVNFFAPFLHESDFTIDRLVDHIEHIAGVMGVEHVGLGPDFVKEVLEDVTPPCCEVREIEGVPTDRFLPGLEGPAGLPLVTEALQKRGWPEEDVVRVLGQNVLDLFRTELRGSAS
ncbi:dipeptidase [Lentzea albida]|uniref:Membrane dipeptidase n=1 Tax=Lentzea albida TaxID=65499 RepID=A0A1H9DVY5_9PSEU|nr:dipeptidase [Lentzea albida]SEQ17033.1 membrane dipeptidase [Lentzea albida]